MVSVSRRLHFLAFGTKESLDPHLLDLLAVQKDFLLAEGFIPNDFAIADYVAEGPLQRARQIIEAEERDLRASA